MILAAVLFGYWKTGELRGRLALLRGWMDFVAFVRDQIAHFSRPLTEICALYSGGMLEKNGCLSAMREGGIPRGGTFTAGLGEGEKNAIRQFTQGIGQGYREDALRLCDYTLEQLKEAEKKRSGELGGEERMYRTVPLMFALSLVLMFL